MEDKWRYGLLRRIAKLIRVDMIEAWIQKNRRDRKTEILKEGIKRNEDNIVFEKILEEFEGNERTVVRRFADFYGVSMGDVYPESEDGKLKYLRNVINSNKLIAEKELQDSNNRKPLEAQYKREIYKEVIEEIEELEDER